MAGWLVSRHTRRADVMALRADAAEQARLVAVQVERARIARELHDVVSHGLSVVVLQTLAARAALADGRGGRGEPAPRRGGGHRPRGPGRDAPHARAAAVRRALAEAPAAPSQGLRHVPELMGAGAAAGLDVDDSAVEPVGPRSAGLELAVYRIVQEALTNVAKHAPGADVAVAVRCTTPGRGGRRR